MRFFSGLVIGAILIVGAAYIRDASTAPEAHAVVNWEVASGLLREAGEWVRQQIAWIGDQLHRGN